MEQHKHTLTGNYHSSGKIGWTEENMPLPEIIAIDGPAASGKSSVAKKMAEELGYLFFDTGVMYRAVTWAVLSAGVSPDDENTVTRIAEQAEIDIRPATVLDGRDNDILLNGQDITWEIRLPEVDHNVSLVSTYAGVRAALTNQQRRIGSRGKVVMAGRDVGTVVMPEAELKVYLDASAEERARRRYSELLQRGKEPVYEEILDNILRRDEIDSTRAISPLKPAGDAVIIHTDHLNLNQVLDRVRSLIYSRDEG